MRRVWAGLAGLLLAFGLFLVAARAQVVETRLAFVVGNANYARGPIKAALNDAGLVAEALRSIGFDVVEGADLSQADFLSTYRDFLGRVEAAGPDAVAFVYVSGYGLEFEGDNYLVATDARIERDTDIPIQAVRLSDLLRSLSAAPARAKIVALDATRPLPFTLQGRPLARGFAAMDAVPGMLVGFSAAPGIAAADGDGDYGTYATAIAEMIREPGLDIDGAFTQIRTRTHQLTQGTQTPWHVSGLNQPIVLVPPDPAQTASAPALSAPRVARRARPMREIGLEQAYALTIETDTLEGYTQFIETFPSSPYSRRVFAIIRARREALAWLRARDINTPSAYWTYLRLYPNGSYNLDAERRLRRLSAAGVPPRGFAMMRFEGVPPPLTDEPEEFVDVELEVGPPPPRIMIAPPPPLFARLPPPERRGDPRMLPVPVGIPAMPHVGRGRNRQTPQTPNTTTTSTPPVTQPTPPHNTPAPQFGAPAGGPSHTPPVTSQTGPAQQAPVTNPPPKPLPPARTPPPSLGNSNPKTVPPTQMQQQPRGSNPPANPAIKQSPSQPATANPVTKPVTQVPATTPAPTPPPPQRSFGSPPSGGQKPVGTPQPPQAKPAAPPPAATMSRPVPRPTPPTPPAVKPVTPPANAPAKKCELVNGQQVCK